MKTGFNNYWVPVKGAKKSELLRQHQKTFPGNQLATVDNYIKVAVLLADSPPKGSITDAEFKAYQATIIRTSILGVV